MKINKLALIICMLFLLNISIVFAVDMKPFFIKFQPVSSNVRTTAEIEIQAYDSGTNPGILWLKLYEDGIEIDEKNCGGATSCSWKPQVVHNEDNNHSYYAQVRDKGPHTENSGTVIVDYDGDFAPQYSNLIVSPASGSMYNASQQYQFNATWVDDWNETDVVSIEHNFTGTMQNYSVLNDGDVYYYEAVGIVPGDYVYRWNATDLSGNSNSTPLQNYSVVAKNPSVCTLNVSPNGTIVYGTAVTALCNCSNPEANATLMRNTVDVTAAENNQSVVLAAGPHDYVCSVPETATYYSGITGIVSLVIDKAFSAVNLTLNGVSNNITVNVNETINVLGTLIAGEENLSLYENMSPIYSSASPLVYNLSYSSPQAVNITLIHPDTQNYSSNDETFVVTVLDPGVNNPPVVTLLSPADGSITNISAVDFVFNVTDDNASTLNCQLWENSTGVFADSTGLNLTAINGIPLNFNYGFTTGTTFDWNILCDDGNLTAFAPANWTVTVGSPNYSVAWDQPALDLGNTVLSGGILTGFGNFTIIGNNTNVTVNCVSGNCSEINTNFTNGVDLSDGVESVLFACDDDPVGNHSAIFEVLSNEDPTPHQISVNCEVVLGIAKTGNVVINEFLADGVIPSTEDDEFIEIYNNDSIQIDVSGWNLGDDSTNYTIPASTVLNPGQFLAYNKSVSGIALSNTGDSLYLYNSTGDLIDSYTYTSATENVSEGRYPDGSSLWLDLTSLTPGAANVYVPSIYLIFNETVLDLGSVEQGNGVLTGAANLSARGNHTNADIICSGDCPTITHDFISKNMSDNESQIVTFTCDDSTVGNYSADFFPASPENMLPSSLNVVCEITPPTNNQPYFISPAVNANIEVNNTFLYDVDAGDLDVGDNLTHYDDAVQFDINPFAGYINFTPTVVEVITATITVCDDSGLPNNCTTQSFRLNVTPGPTNNAPTFWTAPVDTSIEQNNLFTFDVDAIDLDLDNITFSDNAAQFDINASSGLISFTPTVVEVITATITACDDSGFPNNCTTQPFTLNVTQGPVYGVTLTDPADKIVNNATNAVYTLTLTNTGNVPDNYTLNYNNIDNASTVNIVTNLLTDLAAGASNAITVTVGDSAPGNYTVNVTATSVHGPSAEVSITTEVTAVPTQGVLLSDPTGQTVDSVTNAVYTITVTNTGNGIDSFDLSYNNQDNATTVLLNTSAVTNLNPGSSENITLTVGDSAPGNYDITVTAVSQTDASANDTTAVIITTITAAPGGIGGTVENNFNNPLQNVNVSVVSTSLYGMTDAAGAYAISNVNSGTYSVSATPPDNSHLPQTKSGQVVNSGLITSVNFVLTQTGIINGTVSEFFSPTTPISSATVTARIGAVTYGTDVTDANGNYEINGLPPGTYDIDVTHATYTDTTKPLNDLLSGETRTLDFFMW
jgi:hypothetical protein